MCIKELKDAVKLTAKLREESWDEKEEEYSKSLLECSDAASLICRFGLDGSLPIHIMLSHAWNETLDWANK